jgi:hypothetical protein
LAALDVTPLQGSAGNDQLSGTDYRDIILAGAGDDLLTGNRGNDDLHGETGTDSYRLSRGGGADQVFEVEGETSIIEVGAYTLSRLTGTRVGDDLLLGVTEAGGSLTLKNFYTLNHDWQVKDRTSAPRELSALLAENAAYRANRSDMERVQDSFIADIQDGAVQAYQAQGMVQQTDGSWWTPVQVTLSHYTDNYVRSPGYNGNVPAGSNYYSLSTSGLTGGQFSISTYSSDTAEINYSGGGVRNGLNIVIQANVIKLENAGMSDLVSDDLMGMLLGGEEDVAITDFASFGVNNLDFRLQPYGGVPVRRRGRVIKKFDYLHKSMDIERVTRQTRARVNRLKKLDIFSANPGFQNPQTSNTTPRADKDDTHDRISIRLLNKNR